ncbi:uncharacterized protein LOC127855490 [Dreissena polymorpha]|uniref:EF-hand domain-containing protein n=1 Tax=Dreissena polymorpha TaxID=45954 RepID=A0A9D4HH58_DREPO|nr:uncharacterized protein LOC127855490 [Dreissena polymorpha]KAH3718637.1 hypothetical protein DPMN_061443 [Dreissena polymorpha]
MKLVVIAALLGLAYGLSKRVNTHGYTFQQVVDHVIADTDTNHDGLVSFTEFNVELLGQFDLDGDGQVTRNEFVTRWTAKYGDNHHDTNKFFDNIDHNHDHILNEADLTAQWSELNLGIGQLLSASLGTLTEIRVDQFRHFIELNHPHGHGNGR